MDWTYAIDRHRSALLRILATLFAMLGLEAGATAGLVSRRIRRAVVRILRPAEAAVRRLIVVAARGVVLKPQPPRAKPKGPITGSGKPRLSFPLYDPRIGFPRRRVVYCKNPPRVWSFDAYVSAPAAPPEPKQSPEDRVDAARVARRLEALKLALDDLPRQARRLLRLRARRQKVPHLKDVSPLRPGRPPGHRKRPFHEIDEVLSDCHWLAGEALRTAPS